MTGDVPQFPPEQRVMGPRMAAVYWGLRRETGRRLAEMYADPCVMRRDQPHVCRRPDHDDRHGKTRPT